MEQIGMKTTFAKANEHFRAGRYEEALALYRRAMEEKPELAACVQFNIEFAERRIANAHQSKLQQGETTAVRGQIFNAQGTPITLGGNANSCIIEKQQIFWDDENARWVSTGTDPLFLLEPNRLFPAPGFYEWRVSVSSDRDRDLAKLYFDTGSGFSEWEIAGGMCEQGEVLTRIIKIGNTPVAVRFDPREHPGRFEVAKFEISPLDNQTAKMRMLEVVEEATIFRLQPELELWEEIEEEAIDKEIGPLDLLYERYVRTFDIRPDGLSYEEWIETVEGSSLPTTDDIASALDAMEYRPLISVIVPVYNTPEQYLRACIESVISQSYPDWELCIADDNSTLPHVRRTLMEYEEKDSRIHVVYRDENGHISRASNSALSIAKGDYIALLDHDDLMAEHALYFNALAINDKPNANIIYSDEDKIDEFGRRFDAHFKSDWNRDLFYSQNYICHLTLIRRDILESIGGFRPGVEGSQDQDLLLRCLPLVRDDEIIHVPRILYHWRALAGSTALASSEKSYTTEAGIKALSEYFFENGPEGIVVESGLVPNTYRVRWPLPDAAPLVSLLIPTRDKKPVTEVAVRSILDKTTYPNYEIVILNNGSVEEETLDWFREIQEEDPRVRVLDYDHPFNYSAINNFGVRHTKGTIIGLINNDVEVISPEWLSEMVSHAVRKDIGCVGAKLYYGNDTLQHGGVILGLGGVAGHSHKYFPRELTGYFHRLVLTQNLSAVTAACLLVRREIYEDVGGLDEKHLKVAFNDVDFCLRVREAGYRNLWTPYAELYHHESISRGHEDTPEKQARFLREVEYMKEKWGDILLNDPFYNPNLTKDREDFSIGV